MPDEPEDSDRSWLLEPPGPHDVRIHVDVGEGADISPEARAALDKLVQELHASEVEGFAATCPDLDSCSWYRCTLGKCQPQSRMPCLWDERCVVTKFA